MKKLCLFVLVLALSVMLSGCQFILPFFYLNFSKEEQPHTQQTLPIEADVPNNLDAEDIYYRSKFAAPGKAFQYKQQLLFTYTAEEEFYTYDYQVQEEHQITLSEEDCAVNCISSFYPPDYPEESLWVYEYYRAENDSLYWYYADPDENIYTRELIPLEDYTPYVIITDFARYGYPTIDTSLLTLEPQTRILDGREVYLLTYPQNALYAFGYTGNAALDAQLEKRTIHTTWYVDAETFMPVKQEYTLAQIDDVLWQAIDSCYVVGALEAGESFTGFSFSCTYESFEPVEVAPIPSDILQKIWENSGAISS